MRMQRAREIALAAAGLGALALLAARFGVGDLRAALVDVDPARLLAYVVLAVLVLLGHCLRWRIAAGALAVRAPLARFVRARLAGDAVGWIVPSARLAGEPVRFALVCPRSERRRAGAPTGPARQTGEGPRIAAAVAADRIIEIAANLFCTLVYVGVFVTVSAAHEAPGSRTLLVAAASALVALGSVLYASARTGFRPLRPLYAPALRRRLHTLPRLGRWLGALEAAEGHLVGLLRDHPRAFARCLLVSLAVEALVITEYHTLLAAFGVRLPLPTLLMSLVMTGLARAVPTPAGLGALEAGQVTLLELAQNQAGVGFVVGIVLRLHETLWTAVGFAVLAHQGFSLRGVARLARSTEGAG
jgi:uncharacterized membrane protein YbhN (UPF0104 family)